MIGGLAFALVLAARPVAAQGERPAVSPVRSPADTTMALRIFLDCDKDNTPGCDFDFLRTELTWVQYARDRTDAQVHVIATSLSTGSGGSEVLLRYVGQREFVGLDDEIRFRNALGATDDNERRALARFVALGLVRYAARLPDGANLTLQHRRPADAPSARPARDPWNYWLFGIGASGDASGESRSNSSTIRGSVTAQRTTEGWKFESRALADLNRSSYKLSDSTRYLAEVRTYEGAGLLVRSLGQHVSLGTSVSAYSYTVDNFDVALTIAPTIELDVFPYRDFTRRRLVLAYSVGFNRFEYTDTTLYGKVSEELLDQALSLGLATRQPWGNIDIGVTASSYMPEVTKNKVKVKTDFTFRVTRGFQVRAGASYSRVRDQINLPKEDATDEEVLLKLRSLRTDFRFSAQFGLQYTFGSAFNNVVNPRMSSNGR